MEQQYNLNETSTGLQNTFCFSVADILERPAQAAAIQPTNTRERISRSCRV